MATLLFGLVGYPRLYGDDWLTWPSTYTHAPDTGLRVDQFAVGQQPLAPNRSDFVRSGYRHFRSTLQAGQSADNIHIVEQWGRPVVPYEQWRFPFRPYGVPYDAWGPQAPYGITNGYFEFGVNPGGGQGGYGRGGYGQGGYGQGGYGRGGHDNWGAPDWGGYPGQEATGSGPPTANTTSPDPNRHPPYYPWNGPAGPWWTPQPPPRGFPLTPTYNGEPWYDGNYPSAPPLGREGR